MYNYVILGYCKGISICNRIGCAICMPFVFIYATCCSNIELINPSLPLCIAEVRLVGLAGSLASLNGLKADFYKMGAVLQALQLKPVWVLVVLNDSYSLKQNMFFAGNESTRIPSSASFLAAPSCVFV